jgi:hypothetical protein
MQGVEPGQFELLVVLERVVAIKGQGGMDDVVHRAAVGVAQFVGGLLVRAPLGRELDGAGVPGSGEGAVAMRVADERESCGNTQENRFALPGRLRRRLALHLERAPRFVPRGGCGASTLARPGRARAGATAADSMDGAGEP